MSTAVWERLQDQGVEATLDRVELLHDARVEAEAEQFELVTLFADQMGGDELPTETDPVEPGRERRVQLGGEGTPRVAEFACMELGARMQLGAWSARILIADSLDTRHRLPAIWRRVQARQARVGWVRMVARKTRHLSADAAA
jgi:hypothetical protein